MIKLSGFMAHAVALALLTVACSDSGTAVEHEGSGGAKSEEGTPTGTGGTDNGATTSSGGATNGGAASGGGTFEQTETCSSNSIAFVGCQNGHVTGAFWFLCNQFEMDCEQGCRDVERLDIPHELNGRTLRQYVDEEVCEPSIPNGGAGGELTR